MTKLRAVVFDLDGTLIDSVPDIAAALNRCLVDRKRVALSEDAVKSLVGGGARELVAKALGSDTSDAEIDRALSEFLTYYEREPVARTRLYPGARELLGDLTARGLRLAICTNKPIGMTRLILDRLELTPYFASIWGGEPERPLKPDPLCLHTVCAELAAAPAEAAMVGDSRIDIEAARATGCRSVFVSHGYERSPGSTLAPDFIVQSLPEAGHAIARMAGNADSALRQPLSPPS